PPGPVPRAGLTQRWDVVARGAVVRCDRLDVGPGRRRVVRLALRWVRRGRLRLGGVRPRPRHLGLGVQLAERMPVAPRLVVAAVPGVVPVGTNTRDELVRRGRGQLGVARSVRALRTPAAATTGTAADVGLAVLRQQLGNSEPPRWLFTVLST